MKIALSGLLVLIAYSGICQYAPPAGQPGSTAVNADSSVIIGWADSVSLVRGSMNIMQPEQGEVTYGAIDDATGTADQVAVSLGDGGSATYYFDPPLHDKYGADFAVFENSFSDDFLELAFVEISSDGENFARFPAISLTPFGEQVASFGTLDATLLKNFAGKYRGGFGVPFDLEELATDNTVDIASITHIRIVDVIGTINTDFATHDAEGNIVNDPFPTAFNSGGFDLDALALLDSQYVGVEETNTSQQVSVYPNPAHGKTFVVVSKPMLFRLFDAAGSVICTGHFRKGKNTLDCNELEAGVYFLMLTSKSKRHLKKLIFR